MKRTKEYGCLMNYKTAKRFLCLATYDRFTKRKGTPHVLLYASGEILEITRKEGARQLRLMRKEAGE